MDDKTHEMQSRILGVLDALTRPPLPPERQSTVAWIRETYEAAAEFFAVECAPPAGVVRLEVREACRQRRPLDGTDAQMLEHAITMTERERDEARKELSAALLRAENAERQDATDRKVMHSICEARDLIACQRDGAREIAHILATVVRCNCGDSLTAIETAALDAALAYPCGEEKR